jgi:hypothetical protein
LPQRQKRLATKVIRYRRQPPNHPRSRVAKSRAGLGVCDDASLFLELGRVNLAASKTLLQDFQWVGCCGVGFVLVRGTALAAIFAAAFFFGFRVAFELLASIISNDAGHGPVRCCC